MEGQREVSEEMEVGLLFLLGPLENEIPPPLVEVGDGVSRWRIANILRTNPVKVGFQAIVRPGHCV